MVRHMSSVNGLTSYQPTVAHRQWGYHQTLMYTLYMLRYEINISLICQTERDIVRKPVSICVQQSTDQPAYCHFQTTMTFEHLLHVNILHRLNEQSNTCRQQVPLDTR